MLNKLPLRVRICEKMAGENGRIQLGRELPHAISTIYSFIVLWKLPYKKLEPQSALENFIYVKLMETLSFFFISYSFVQSNSFSCVDHY